MIGWSFVTIEYGVFIEGRRDCHAGGDLNFGFMD